MQTVEAYLQKNIVKIPNNIYFSDKKIKVLVTFLEEENNLYQLESNEISQEILNLSKITLNKDKSLFNNI